MHLAEQFALRGLFKVAQGNLKYIKTITTNYISVLDILDIKSSNYGKIPLAFFSINCQFFLYIAQGVKFKNIILKVGNNFKRLFINKEGLIQKVENC